MFDSLRIRLTFANVTSVIALFVALSGSAYAALTITGKNVKNSSLSGADVRNNSLGSLDIKNGGLLATDFKPGQLPAGSQGPKGDTGVGAQGPPGISGLERVQVNSAQNSISGKSATAPCPPGKSLIGSGGATFNGGTTGGSPDLLTDVALMQILPSETSASAFAAEEQAHTGTWGVTAYAICANVAP